MTREKTALPRLALVGGACGLGGALAYLLLVRLLVGGPNGLSHLGVLSLAVPGGPAGATVRDLGTLTWVGLPAEVVSLLAPVVLLTAGLVAGRLTYATRAGAGVRAGLAVVLGFAPPMLLVWVAIGGPLATTPLGSVVGAVVVPVLSPLLFGGVGGVVGVKT